MIEPAKLVAGGRYELEELVGQGGYGGVYRALDRVTGRPVAVKVLTARTTDDPHGVERMVREQQALVALAGTSAVSAVDLCCLPSGALCLVMEWLEGIDLERHLSGLEVAGQRLDVSRVLDLLEPVVDTLARAHEVGIVHRDIKPANIFLEAPNDAVRLLDFGLARIRSQAPLTAVGMVVGSPSYIAPEAWRGDSKLIGHRADLYSLGIVAFRMLSGTIPFEADTLLARYSLVTTAPRPSLHALRPDLPRMIDEWVQQALAIHPEFRFNTARAWFNALSSALRDEEVSDTSEPSVAQMSAAERRSVVSSAFEAAASLLERLAAQWQATRERPRSKYHPGPSGSVDLPPPVAHTGSPFAGLPGMEGVLSTPAWPTSDPAEGETRDEERESLVSQWLVATEFDPARLSADRDVDVVTWLRGSEFPEHELPMATTPSEVRAFGERLNSTLADEPPETSTLPPEPSSSVDGGERATDGDGGAVVSRDAGAGATVGGVGTGEASTKRGSSKSGSSKSGSSKRGSGKPSTKKRRKRTEDESGSSA